MRGRDADLPLSAGVGLACGNPPGIMLYLRDSPGPPTADRKDAALPTLLCVHHVSCIGGAENSLLTLLSALDRDRWRATVVLPGPGPLADAAAELGCPVAFAPLFRPRRTASPLALCSLGFHTAGAALALARLFRRLRPDVVHANSTAAHLLAAGPARLAHAATVWHVRDLRRCRPLERPLLAATDALVAISRAVMASFGKTLPRRVLAETVANGIDVERFRAGAEPGRFRSELGLPAGRTLAACISQIVPWKGLDVLLEAFARCVRGGADVHLVLVGSDLFGDHPDLASALRARADAPDLRGRVTLAGYRSDVPTIVHDADLVVVPSRGEPFGRVCLEAMAEGRPVVGTRSGGLPEVVLDGQTGLLVPPGEPGPLADAIARLASDAALARRLGAAGLDRVRAVFSSERHARRMEEVFEKALARRAARAGGQPR